MATYNHDYFISSVVCLLFMFIMFVSHTEGQKLVPAVFMFGDSLVDVGNNNHLELSLAKANFPHNGVDYPHRKPTGRFSNGKNSADLVAEKLGLPTAPPYLMVRSILNRLIRTLENSNMTKVITEGGGMSFASGGAGILNETDILFKKSISMSEQIDYFSKVKGEMVQHLGGIGSQTFLSKSIIGVSIGSNDLLGYFKPNSSLRKKYGTPQQYIDLLVLKLKGQLKRIYDLGGRKFAISGTGLVGCCPSQRIQNKTGNGECYEETNQGSFKLNEGIKAMLQELKSEFMDMNFSLFSTYNVMVEAIQNPSQYGFIEVRSACCGLGKLKAEVPCLPIATYCSNRNDHIFWDLYHPTEAAVKVLINTYFDGSPKYTYPMNLGQLAAI